ncbi:2Fe-2S iron-sulfur cluster-binding protein [Robiginitalea sediminis]|uniref:2Fe-2S iron-sulfur cluster-binding protein n=1 Tax=Robiginitalea sediminis TaxID=1982593 RepID=UPI000B4B7321|nr:2Fe-2S iron-sulfur cluster-binding protein [Robiginitalea sediminis]
MSDFFPLTLNNVRNLTPDAVELCLSVPDNLKETFAFKAGQYITFRHTVGGTELRRAYSIASAPGSSQLCVGVKKVDGGRFSVFANEALQEGDTLEVMPPQGRFVFDPATNQNILAVAAGSGITPMMSIIRAALEQNQSSRVVLLFGNRSAREAMYLEEIRELSQKYTDRFTYYFTFSREQEADALFGRIEKSTLNFILKNKHVSETFDRYYLCGPQEMIEMCEVALGENGVAPEAILHELFTEPDGESAVEGLAEGQSQVEIVLDEQTFTLTMSQKDVILDAALKNKIDAPYSCQGGVCSTCIARVTEGSAKMAKNQILTDSEIEEGFVLTCQAHPTSAVVKVDYDDV